MMIPESWNEESRRNMGTTKGVSAARTPRDVNDGVRRLRVLRGLAYIPHQHMFLWVWEGRRVMFTCTFVCKTMCASPEYFNLNTPRNLSSPSSPISNISRSGGVVPRLNSLTTMLSVMMGGIGAFESAEVRS